MPVRNIQILVVIMLVCIACYVQAERLKYAGKIGSAIQLIEQNFVEERDPQELYYAAMDGIVSRLDRFSEFIPPAKYEQFQAGIEQEFGGLGILVEGPPVAQQITVVAPIPGTPAFRAGLQPGDIIAQIAGEPTEGMFADKASEMMRGPVGESVVLRIRRAGEPLEFDVQIERADIQVDSIYGDRIRADSSWDYFLKEDRRIAYIRINLFGEKTVAEFEKALAAIQPEAQAVILDLRYNPGGILSCAVQLCNMLVDKGVVVSTRGRRDIFGSEFRAKSEVQLPLDIPMVVLINQQSASASEIMAGCLQDLGRAKIAGSRSFGKGTVQQVFPLDNDQTALKFTTARFYRPSGKNIHRTEEMNEEDEWGVSPDSDLELKVSDLQNLYLNQRWRRNGDPRITASPEQPPAPACAGDPQLKLVLDYLQAVLDGSHRSPGDPLVEQERPAAQITAPLEVAIP
ncbi:MAG: S41 family peptidase [bacterium]|nr:S41 family peptidase [bacterium]